MTGARPRIASELIIALHAHLPYTRPDALDGDAIESDWLFESVAECYVPLSQVLQSWVTDRVPASIFVSLSPTLLDMLADPRLMGRCRTHLLALADYVRRERAASADPRLAGVLAFYDHRLAGVIAYLDAVDWDLIGAFAALEREGVCELGTTAATHAFLPLHAADFVRAEISAGLDTFARHVGHRPAGMWLPECGVDQHVLDVLAAEGVRFTFVDEHCVQQGTPNGEPLTPAATADGVTLLARHPALSAQVWSADEGYPGDPRYREFHRDRGYDVPRADVLPHTREPNARRSVGLKYHAITSKQTPLADKAIYRPEAAADAVATHVEHFASTLEDVCSRHARWTGRPATCVLPFDAELFGHWWLEGVEFLDRLARRLSSTGVIALTAPSAVSVRPVVLRPADGSWGWGGYGETWLNEANDWILPLLRAAWTRYDQTRDDRTRDDRARPEPATDESAAAALRELMLAAASDWPFMITTGVLTDLAERRVREHLARFDALMNEVEAPSRV